jgi:hypothetical protein
MSHQQPSVQREIYRAANEMIERYGDKALSIATKRASTFADKDDIECAALWLLVIRAIKELASTTPNGPMH